MGLAISLTKIYGNGNGTLSKLGLSSPNRKQTRACEAIKRNVMVLGNETGTKAAREVPHGGEKKRYASLDAHLFCCVSGTLVI